MADAIDAAGFAIWACLTREPVGGGVQKLGPLPAPSLFSLSFLPTTLSLGLSGASRWLYV